MPGSNLTRSEAATRAGLIKVSTYDVTLDLTDGSGAPSERTFASRSVVRFTATPGATTFIDLLADTVHRATLNGAVLDTTGFDSDAGLALTDLTADNELVVEAHCLYTNSGEGLHRFVDPVDDQVYLYSQFETADAHRVYACFDQPDLKARFTFHVTAPAAWEVVSNAGETSVEETPVVRTVHFAQTELLSTYVTAVVAGPYHVEREEHDGIPLGLYCRQSLKPYLDSDNIFQITRQGFDFYHQKFGTRYAFGKYDQLFVPEFNAGAMENAACVTFLEDYLFRGKVTDFAFETRANTILHEMAHMWFGDLVTMRWWDDLWLNESFAEWASHYAVAEGTRFSEAWTGFATGRKAWGYRQDQLSSTHPIAADMVDIQAVEVNFDGITYAKGASVLKQLVAYVGQGEFLNGLRGYFTAHAFGNATFADLLGALEQSSGRDLSGWAEQWIKTEQVNTLRPQLEVAADGAFGAVAVLQEAPDGYPTLRTHRLAIGLYDLVDGRLVRRHRVECDIEGARTDVPDLVGVPQPDLLLLNDDDLTYAKIRLDERSLATLTEHVGDFTDSLPRALCWAASWDMCRDGELAARDYLRLVLSGIDRESTIGVVQALLRQLLLVLSAYADPAWSAQGYRQLADTALDRLRSAEAGSDFQLTWTRTFASAARTPQHLDVLHGLLAGTESVPGLAVDTELRWHLLQCLTAMGRADEDAIATELARDATDAGAREAATCRALVPTAAAKAEAWRIATEDDAVPNQTGLAYILGFGHPAQRELLTPYADRYFASVADVWARRSSEVAQNVAIYLYPSWAVAESTLASTEAFLAREDLPAPLRRLVGEGRDGVVRALAARRCDAAAARR